MLISWTGNTLRTIFQKDDRKTRPENIKMVTTAMGPQTQAGCLPVTDHLVVYRNCLSFRSWQQSYYPSFQNSDTHFLNPFFQCWVHFSMILWKPVLRKLISNSKHSEYYRIQRQKKNISWLLLLSTLNAERRHDGNHMPMCSTWILNGQQRLHLPVQAKILKENHLAWILNGNLIWNGIQRWRRS